MVEPIMYVAIGFLLATLIAMHTGHTAVLLLAVVLYGLAAFSIP